MNRLIPAGATCRRTGRRLRRGSSTPVTPRHPRSPPVTPGHPPSPPSSPPPPPCHSTAPTRQPAVPPVIPAATPPVNPAAAPPSSPPPHPSTRRPPRHPRRPPCHPGRPPCHSTAPTRQPAAPPVIPNRVRNLKSPNQTILPSHRSVAPPEKRRTPNTKPYLDHFLKINLNHHQNSLTPILSHCYPPTGCPNPWGIHRFSRRIRQPGP